MYGVDASKKTFKLKKAYNVNASKKTEGLKKCYVVNADRKLEKLWSSFTPMYFSSYNNILYKSENLVVWDVADTFDGTKMQGMLFVNGKYYIVCSSKVYLSEDGTTWELLSTIPNSGGMKKLRYLNGRFIAIGGSHTIWYSNDAITWTQATLSTYYQGYGGTFTLEDIGYGTVGGTTGYYLLVKRELTNSTPYSCGVVLARHTSFDDMIGKKNASVLFNKFHTNVSVFLRMSIVNGTLYIVHSSRQSNGSSSGATTYIHAYSTSCTDVFTDVYNYASVVWSSEKSLKWKMTGKKIYTRLYNGTSNTQSSNTPTLKEYGFMLSGLCVDERLVHIEGGTSSSYSSSVVSYSDDGGESFTSITLDKNIFCNSSGVRDGIALLYSNEYGGFYTE